MSIVLNKGKIKLGNLRYPALVMEECINKFIESKYINNSDIPRGIYKGIARFFENTLNIINKKSRPLTGSANFKIAMDAIEKSKLEIKNIKDFEEKLNDFAISFEGLNQNKKLTSKEIEKLKNLKTFFHEIYLNSDAKNYESVISSKFRF